MTRCSEVACGRRAAVGPRLAAVAVGVAAALAGPAAGETLQEFLSAKEAALATARDRAAALHSNRCSTLGQKGADTCQVPSCGSLFPASKGFDCKSGFGPSGFSSRTTSVVRFAPETDFEDAETRAFVSSTGALDGIWSKNLADKKVGAWQYVGHTSGAIRKLPGVPDERSSQTCADYDARLRPWYAAAASGPKDVVLVLDTSGSMARPSGSVSRIEALKRTVLALLQTMTPNDFVGIVQFNTGAQAVGGARLQSATPEAIETLSSAVQGLVPGGETAMSAGLTRGFQMLDEQEHTGGCTRVLQFLTDGLSSEDDGLNKAVAAVDAGQAVLGTNRAHLFTYSMGSNAGRTIEQRIACGNKGVWMPISDGQDPLQAMGQYYQLLASGIDNTKPRWTNPYEDAFGLGRMVTATLPVYDRSRSIALLTSVVSIDVTVAELEKFGRFEAAVGELTARGATCASLSLTDCHLQYLREPTGYVCPEQPAVSSCAPGGADDFVIERCTGTGNVNEHLCQSVGAASHLASPSKSVDEVVSACNPATPSPSGGGATKRDAESSGGNTGVILGVVLGVLALLVLAVVGLCLCRCMSRRAQRKSEESRLPETDPYTTGFDVSESGV